MQQDHARKSDFKHASGLGSAKSGMHHWLVQRLTAVALVPLVIWFLVSASLLYNRPFIEAVQYVANPFHAVAAILFVAVGVYHAMLGVQVIIEDYVHSAIKTPLLWLSLGLHWLTAVIGVFMVLRIAL